MAFVLVQIFHYLKITVSQLLVIIDCCHLFIFFIIIYLIYLHVDIFYIYSEIIFTIRNCNILLYKFTSVFFLILIFILLKCCISDIVIYLIYIDLMQKRCKLINVDVVSISSASPTFPVTLRSLSTLWIIHEFVDLCVGQLGSQSFKYSRHYLIDRS